MLQNPNSDATQSFNPREYYFHPRKMVNCRCDPLQIARAVNHPRLLPRYFAINSKTGGSIAGGRSMRTHLCPRLRSRMTCPKKRSDYALNKKLLLFLGLWPEPSSNFRTFRIAFVYTVYFAYLLLQVITCPISFILVVSICNCTRRRVSAREPRRIGCKCSRMIEPESFRLKVRL